jgi:5-methylcytosine-specific restriction enzyme subunit McrC
MTLHKTFEFKKIGNVNRSFLQPYLQKIWDQRFSKLEDTELPEGKETERYQGILSFNDNNAYAKNYIGLIQTTKDQIEIYPKVFREYELDQINTRLFLKHLFFWFDYCRKWKFPFTKNNLDQNSAYDLPELIINLMADRIKEVISQAPISLYEETEESLIMPRGRINFNRYISRGLSNGNYQIIECDDDPFLYNNKLNQCIKYVTRLLYKKATFSETHEKLNEILFILDEVDDISFTSTQINTIQINSFYSDYLELIDICRLVLDQQIYDNQYYDQTQWCLLFPMEYIFEDFIAGFLERKFKGLWKVEYQKSEKYLTDEGAFQMQHDIFLTSKINKNFKIIVDTKYKLRTPKDRLDKKKGISQSDLYQMTCYAIRRGCNNVLLLYPNFSEELQENDSFTISSYFNGKDKIHVIAAEVPFWSMTKFNFLSEELYKRLNDTLNFF